MENSENPTFEDIKAQLIFLLQEKKFIEYDKLLNATAKEEKIGKVALKKEIENLAKKDYDKNILNQLSHNIPNGYFLQDNSIMKEIKDGIAFVCEYCVVSEIHRTNDNEESLFTIHFPNKNQFLSGVYMGDKIKDFKNYLMGFIRVNIQTIPTVIRVNKTGWQEVFITENEITKRVKGYCNPILKPDLTYTDIITNTIHKDGDLLTATQILKTALCYKGSCISVLAGLASVLIKPFSKNGLSNFVVNYSGTTGEGKTLSARIGLSMFGNVQDSTENSLLNSMNSTAVGNEFLFSQFLDMPILLDEAGTIKGNGEKKAQHIIEVIFQFFSGTGKTRGQKNLTLRKTEKSRGVLFLTMEYDLKTIEKQSGVIEKGYYRRTIEVDTSSGNFLPSKDIYDFTNINSNYGWIAEIFINSIIANNYDVFEELQKDFLKYEKELSRVELRGKEKYFAILHVVLEHLKRIGLILEYEYQKAKEQLKIVYDENLETMADITTNKAQIWAEQLQEFLAMNKSKFEGFDKEVWGSFTINKEQVQEIHIYPSILSNFCMQNGINERSFCKELFEKGTMTTEKTSTGVRYTVKRKNLRVFCFLQKKLEELGTINKDTIIEMQKIIENAEKYITPVEMKKDTLIGVDGKELF
jgi:uncharacterized protein (DUF927 family)